MPQTISAPVGTSTPWARAVNFPSDVKTVQQLLNEVPPESGGPVPALAVDGIVGPKTSAAISKFQQAQFGKSDGLVEPGQRTIQRLLDLSGDFRLCGRDELPVSPFTIPRL
jgi:peptidoglycan hydrolase-like protein with peptidoglycan-binding domain